MAKPQSVDEYIVMAPVEQQAKLRELRKIIRRVVPEAEEKLSYGMPYYGLKGRLAYFGYATNHIGLYIPPPVIANFKKDLRGYVTSTSTVQFPKDELLPVVLIEKLIKARAEINLKKKKS